MAVKYSNRQMMITISKEDYARLVNIATAECRSVSRQALMFLLQGMKNFEEEKRG